MSGSGMHRWPGTNTLSATIVLLPVADIPVAYQSSTIVSSRLRAITHVGTASATVPTTAFNTVHLAPWQPVLNPHRPLTTRPSSFFTPVPVGENTPLMRGSPSAKISSWAWSGNVAASHDIALKIVATHEVDAHPRASSASTSDCVWKSASSPPYFFGAVIRNTPALLSASKLASDTRRACSAAAACSWSIGMSEAARSTSEGTLMPRFYSEPSARLSSTDRSPSLRYTRTRHGLQQTSQSCTNVPRTSGSI